MPPRPARPGDADAIVDVFLAARAGMTYLPAPPPEDATNGVLRRVLLDESEVLVAEDAGGVAGFASLHGDVLAHLYVRPEAQGRGLGTELLEAVKRRRPEGFTLWVFQRNEGARRFYERHGLRLVLVTDGAGNMEREPDALYEWRPVAR